MGSGQQFLLGQNFLNRFYARRKRKQHHQTPYVIIYDSTAPAHECRESLQSIFPGFTERDVDNHTALSYWICTRVYDLCQLPRAINHFSIGFKPALAILTPTELIPGACSARLATLPTHTITLSVPASSGKRFPRFLFLLSTPTHSKRLWITGWHAEALAWLLCFYMERDLHLLFPWIVKHSPLSWGLTCT